MLSTQSKNQSSMNRIIYHRQITIQHLFKNYLQIYRNSPLYSTIKMGVSVLKHSRFSEFMGLAQQLRKLQRQQQKMERSQVRINITIIIICLLGISCAAIFINGDPSIRLKMSIMKKKMQLGFYKQQKKIKLVVEDMLSQVDNFLKENPYDYANVIALLTIILNQSKKLNDGSLIEQAITNAYLQIMKRNHTARSSKIFLEGLSCLLEHFLLNNRPFSNLILLEALVESGSIKQVFLALTCIKQHQIHSQLKHKIQKNVQNQSIISSKYFALIFENFDESELPQIIFKRDQIHKWSTYIEKRLQPKQAS